MRKSKKLFAVLLSVMMVLCMMPAMAFADDAQGYLMINGQKYQTAEELKSVTDGETTILTDGAVVEVYGKVDLPLHTENQPNLPTGHGGYIWYLGADNVKIVGMTEDAALFSSQDSNDDAVNGMGGMGGRQALILVYGDGAVFQDVTVMPNYNTYNAPENCNKTIEVFGKNFTMDCCVMKPQDGKQTEGGALYFNGNKGTETVTNSTFSKSIICFGDMVQADEVMIESNVFDGQGDYTSQFISTVSWAAPPNKTVADVTFKENHFQNLPDDYKRIVAQRMQGKFTLIDNTIDDGRKMEDLVHFEARDDWNTLEELASGSEAVIIAEGVTKEVKPNETGTTVVARSAKRIEAKAASCTKPGNREYWYCEAEQAYYADAELTTEISLEDTVIPAIGHHFEGGVCTVCGAEDPDYNPGENGEPTTPPTDNPNPPAGGTTDDPADTNADKDAPQADKADKEDKDAPKTGDATSAMPFVLLVTSLAAAGSLIALRKREE